MEVYIRGGVIEGLWPIKCPQMPNKWLAQKKTWRINGGAGDEGLQEGKRVEQNTEMNSAGCEIP